MFVSTFVVAVIVVAIAAVVGFVVRLADVGWRGAEPSAWWGVRKRGVWKHVREGEGEGKCALGRNGARHGERYY